MGDYSKSRKTKMERDLTHYPANPTLNKVGLRAKGQRSGSKSDGMEGTIVEAYYTLNDNFWKNYAYKLLCDDGKIRSFQGIELIKEEK